MNQQIRKAINELEHLDDKSVYHTIENQLDILYPKMPIIEKENEITRLFNQLRRMDIIQTYMDDDSISEIMVNGYQHIFVEKEGKIEEIEEKFPQVDRLEILIQAIVAKMDKKVNEKYPICDVRLEDGSRVNIVLPPIALDGPYVTIRKFPKERMTDQDLIRNHTISIEAMGFLKKLVAARYNIFISGGTSSGKTTLLNILSNAITEGERVITIEDSAELQLQGIPNLIRMETRRGDEEYVKAISIRDLIRSSLRMRPDRIIVGEVRGEETIDMLQAMNTGHEGSLSTGHGNSVLEMLSRLETMVLSDMDLPLVAIRQQIASALDFIVHIQKIPRCGRRIVEIAEILSVENGVIQTNTLYTYNSRRDVLERTNKEIVNNQRWIWLEGRGKEDHEKQGEQKKDN